MSLVLALGAFSLAGAARGEQFVLFDATFDYSWEDAENSSPSKSHFYVNDENFLNTERPDDWLSPVDYRNGTLHVRTEVFEKPPGDQEVGWTLCYIPNSGGYGCADTTYYTSTGVFDRETPMTDWWNNDQLDWSQGIKQMDLIYAIDDSGSGHVTNYPELKELTTPTRVRITMVQVSAGSTYDPSILELPGGGGGSGGLGGSGGSAGSAGSSLLPMGGSGGSAGGGYGGLLGMAGSTAGSGGVAGSPSGGAAGSPSGGNPSRPATAAAPSSASSCSLVAPGARSTSWLALGLLVFGLDRRARSSRRARR